MTLKIEGAQKNADGDFFKKLENDDVKHKL